jgi:hypothetical protein
MAGIIQAGTLGLAEWFDLGTYVPVLTATTTNPTLGSGSTQSGWWQRVNNLITGGAFVRFGTSGVVAGSGNYQISLPFPADTAFMIAAGGLGTSSMLGDGLVRDNSAVSTGSRQFSTYLETTTTMLLALANGTNQVITDAVPFVFAASDALTVNFTYQADPASL